MTDIDSTVVPEVLAEELLDAVIQDNETHVSRLGTPKSVFMTSQYSDSTVIPSVTISGRTITFHLAITASAVVGDTAHMADGNYGLPKGYYVLIKGRA